MSTQNPAFGPRAACKTVDPEVFFPDPGRRVQARKAIEVCAGCPLLRQCATWAAPRVQARLLSDCVVGGVQTPASTGQQVRFDAAAGLLAEVALLGHLPSDQEGWAA